MMICPDQSRGRAEGETGQEKGPMADPRLVPLGGQNRAEVWTSELSLTEACEITSSLYVWYA